MKKKSLLILLMVLVLTAALLSSCGNKPDTTDDKNEPNTSKQVVNVFNWEDYIDESVLEQFEEETGIHVNYMRFTMNEDMLVQVESNPSAFDVVFPSDYCIQRLTAKDLLQEIDYSKIPNFQYIREDLKNPSYDPENKHSVPYMCGTLGILINTDIVDETEAQSWNVLWNEKYKGQVMMMDSIRDTMGLALKYLGYSVNTTDFAQVKEASDLLIAQKKAGMVKQYGVDELKDKMVAGEAAMAILYSGDAEYSLEEAEKENEKQTDESKKVHLKYVIPQEGSNIWVDGMVIPKGAENLENAYKFIDFLCRPDIAQKNIEEIWYMCVNQAAIENMGEDYSSLYILNPTEEEVARCEYYNDLDQDTLQIYTTLWNEVKNSK